MQLLTVKMKRLSVKIIVIAASILMFSCDQTSSENEVITLPFYNDPQFTPQWIEEGSESYNQIHTISNFSFQDQHNQTITQKDMEGKIFVSNFFFTSCPGICPRMMANIMKVQEEFKDDENFAILSHSVTPWIDSVAQLKSYAMHKGITSKNWHLLTGEKLAIYTIARESYYADEGFGKSVTIEDDFLHTENLVLVDTKGRIRGVYNATLQVEINRLIDDIKLLQKHG